MRFNIVTSLSDPRRWEFADPDTSAFTDDFHGFRPHNSLVQYRLIEGYAIEAKMMAETKAQLSEMARLLELCAKTDVDPNEYFLELLAPTIATMKKKGRFLASRIPTP